MFKKLERSQGFHPRRLAPPNAITPGYYVIIAKHRGGMGGQALSPPSAYPCFFIFISRLEELR